MDQNELRKHAGLPLNEALRSKEDLIKKVSQKLKAVRRTENKAVDAFFRAVAERAIWGHMDVSDGHGTLKSDYDDELSPEENFKNLFLAARDSAKNVGFEDVFGDDSDVFLADALDDVKMKL
jgi:hypothetical protein